MKRVSILFLGFALLLLPLVATSQNVVSKKQGFSMKMQLDNKGVFGRQAYPGGSPTVASGLLGLEYPVGQPIEHLYGAGIWVGAMLDTTKVTPPAKIKTVTTSYEGWFGPLYEMYPRFPGDTIYSIPGKRAPKPAGWDSYWGGALNYNPISDNDMYMAYYDNHGRSISGHVPMGLKVIQSSYVWDDTYADAIMIVEYKIINVGSKPLDSAYVGFFFEADVGPNNAALYYQRNFTGYYPNSRTAYIHNPSDRGSTPVGVSLLRTSKPLDSLKYSFRWHPGPQSPANDEARYNLLASGQIQPDEFPALSDTRCLFGFGPFFIKPSGDTLGIYGTPDTLNIAVAFVSGYDPAGNHLRIMQRNAARALDIYLNQGIRLPATPPSPPLKLEVGFRKIKLDWKWAAGDSVGPNGRHDPERNWDSTNQVARRYPDRVGNPPAGIDPTRGGRNFSAYKVWRSEHPGTFNSITGKWDPPPDGSFTLVMQVDVPTDSFEYNSGQLPYSFDGLKPHTFVDSNLVRGKVYWYSVTSKSIPNLAYQQIVISGQVVTVEVPVDPLESRIATNAVRVDLPFSVSHELGKVAVVPNPYRTDVDYTLESGGYEGLNFKWDENKRIVKFINLPKKCIIRVFSLAGDLVRTVNHDGGADEFPRGDIDFPLLSESNRALASGIYIFTVESDLGVQTGKFVIIR